MPTPVYPVAGLSSIAQKKLTNTIASQGYARSGFGYAITGLTRGDVSNPLSIGRPGEGAIFSGGDLSMAEKKTLLGRESYNPRIQAFFATNTAVVGPNGTMPQVANATTQASSQAMQAAADFKWFSQLITPIYLRQYDLDMAVSKSLGNDEALGLAVGLLIEMATEVATNDHLDNLWSRVIYGNPSSQFVAPADDLQGVLTAGGLNGSVYGGVDRTPLGDRDGWNVVQTSTAFPLDIYKLALDVNYGTPKFNVYGSGKKIIFCGATNYQIFRNQILARDKDTGILRSKEGSGLPEMAKIGVEKEVLIADDCYVIYEPFLDTCYGCTPGTVTPLYTARPTYIVVANMKLWTMMFHPMYNMKIGEFKDISNLSLGAPRAQISFIQTMAILACDRPRLGVTVYSNVS